MAISMIGRKVGMMRLYDGGGRVRAVTAIELGPNVVTQLRSPERDGYSAVQLGYRGKRKRLTRPARGHLRAASIDEPLSVLREFRTDGDLGLSAGESIGVDQFEAGQKVDVSGTSKGKGFAGVIKRWNFSHQDNTHGNSLSHRAPGSIGQCQTPGRVFKGKKMAGHMGNAKVTTQNLEVVRVDVDRNMLLVKGAVPGPAGGDVYIRPAVKG